MFSQYFRGKVVKNDLLLWTSEPIAKQMISFSPNRLLMAGVLEVFNFWISSVKKRLELQINNLKGTITL